MRASEFGDIDGSDYEHTLDGLRSPAEVMADRDYWRDLGQADADRTADFSDRETAQAVERLASMREDHRGSVHGSAPASLLAGAPMPSGGPTSSIDDGKAA